MAIPVVFPHYVENSPEASAVVHGFILERSTTFAKDAPLGQARCLTAPTAAWDEDIQQNGSSVGTVSFLAAATVGSFTFAAEVKAVIGDYFTFHAPATSDATIAGVMVTLPGVQ